MEFMAALIGLIAAILGIIAVLPQLSRFARAVSRRVGLNSAQPSRKVNRSAPSGELGTVVGRTLSAEAYFERLVTEIESYVPGGDPPRADESLLTGYLLENIARCYVSPALVSLHPPDPSVNVQDGLPTLRELLCRPERTIIFLTGGSGSGKSSTMLRLLYEFASDWRQQITSSRAIPMFVPLREYNPQDDFGAFVRRLGTERYHLTLGEHELTRGLKNGEIVLLLDGLDEVPRADYTFLRPLMETLYRGVVTAKTILIDSFEDLEIYALTESQSLARRDGASHVFLFEIQPVDAERRRSYLALKGRSNLSASLEDERFQPLAASMIALRFIAEEPDILATSTTLTDVYSAYSNRLNAWFCVRNRTAATTWLTTTAVAQFLSTVAMDCFARGVTQFQLSARSCPAFPADQQEVLVRHPILSRVYSDLWEFTHASWIAFLAASRLYAEIRLRAFEHISAVMVDRSVSVFSRELVKASDVPALVGGLENAVERKNDILIFNLSHILQSYFLRRGVAGFDALGVGPLESFLLRLDSLGDIIVEGYASRIRAQVSGPRAAAAHVERLRSSGDASQRNLSLFVRYNRGIEGLVSQMVRHFRDAATYDYCVLIDAFVIESSIPLLRRHHAMLLAEAVESGAARHGPPVGERLEELASRLRSYAS